MRHEKILWTKFSSKLEEFDETNPFLSKYVGKTDSKEKKSQNSCYGLNFVPHLPHPPKSMQYIEILPSKVTVLEDGAFGRCLPHESGGLLGGISAAIEKAQRLLYPLCPARTQQEGATYEPGRGPSPACDFAGALVFGFQLPELWEMHLCCL